MKICIAINDSTERRTITDVCAENGLNLVPLSEDPTCVLVHDLDDVTDLRFNQDKDRPAVLAVMAEDAAPDRVYMEQIETFLSDGIDDVISVRDLTQEGLSLRMAAARYHRVDLRRGRQALERLTLFESVVLNANDAVLITDPSTRGDTRKILYANSGFTRISGYTMDEVLGRSPSLLQGPLTNPDEVKRIRDCVTRYEPVQAELINYHKNGTPYWIEISVVPVRNSIGTCTHFIAIQRDITSRKRAERDLVSARREAEMASSSKSQFLASASHDLRQPMQALTFLTTVLKQRTKATDVESIAHKIDQSLNDLSGLFNAILDISKLEVGVTTPEILKFDLAPMIERIEREAVIQCSTKGLQFRRAGRETTVASDPVLLERMVRNLVANAMRYTDKGGVMLAVRRRKTATWIEVYDTGIGIPPNKLGEIFEEFKQLHNKERQRNQGLGLGLSIVERIANLLGASITVLSRPGHGSMFRITLPHPLSDLPLAEITAMEPSEDVADLSHLHVLLVEDDGMVREATQNILETAGAKVTSESRATAAMKKLAKDDSIDVVVSDFRLGGRYDGLEMLSKLRQNKTWDGPAILVTGETAPDQIKRAQKSGYALLFKPIDATTLTQTIARTHRQILGATKVDLGLETPSHGKPAPNTPHKRSGAA